MITSLTLAIAAAAFGNSEVPKSIGPHRNIIEIMTMPPDLLLHGDGSDRQEACLTTALAFGIGGAPLVLHESGVTTIASLLDRTFGLVSLMVRIRTDHVIEVRGRDVPQLRMVGACVGGDVSQP